MKLFDRSTEIESIDIQYKNGKRYSIWLPQEVNIALKLLYSYSKAHIALIMKF